MVQLPVIHLIHTSDAPQHVGRLKEILRQLKAEHRISTFITWSLEDEIAPLSDKVASGDLVLTLLTQALEPRKEEIEQLIQKTREQTPDLEIVEIIVDNIPYQNEFITFPADLKPIRNREDTEAVWGDIAESLRDIFPVQEKEAAPSPTPTSSPSQWLRYLKWAGIVIVALFLFFFLIRVFVDFGSDKVRKVDPPDVVPVPDNNGPRETAEAAEEPASQMDCYVTTGMMSRCHVRPDPFSDTQGTFPGNKRYDVIDTRVYEHGNLTEIYFFRIRDREEGLEGWVSGRSLDYFSDACIND